MIVQSNKLNGRSAQEAECSAIVISMHFSSVCPSGEQGLAHVPVAHISSRLARKGLQLQVKVLTWLVSLVGTPALTCLTHTDVQACVLPTHADWE